MSLNALTTVLTAGSALLVLGYGSLGHAGNGPTTMTGALAGADGSEPTRSRALPSGRDSGERRVGGHPWVSRSWL